jgi:hypothetical protein
MGTGPNYGLAKGMLAQGGAVAYAAGELLIHGTVEQSCARATSASTLVPLGVCIEDVDSAKVGTGKVFVGVALEGIVRVKCGAAVTRMARITNDTSARGVVVTRAAAGAQPQPVFGIALTTTSNANEFFDMLLTPGGTF